MAKKDAEQTKKAPNSPDNMHHFLLAIPLDMWVRIGKGATEEGVSYSDWIRTRIARALREEEK